MSSPLSHNRSFAHSLIRSFTRLTRKRGPPRLTCGTGIRALVLYIAATGGGDCLFIEYTRQTHTRCSTRSGRTLGGRERRLLIHGVVECEGARRVCVNCVGVWGTERERETDVSLGGGPSRGNSSKSNLSRGNSSKGNVSRGNSSKSFKGKGKKLGKK